MRSIRVELQRKCYAPGCPDVIGALEFVLEPGEFVALVGPSGAGKTTLLNLIAGLDTKFDGRVSGTERARIGFVFQEPRLLPWMSVSDNLRLVAPELGDAALHASLKRVGLADQADTLPLRLSGGMQRRVALLRAFLIRPELLLLDEPFISLDAPTCLSLHRLLMELCGELMPTMLLVTHDLREALALADRVLFVSAAPARLVLDHSVRLPRPRTRDEACVSRERDALLQKHPELLAGLCSDRPGAEGPGADPSAAQSASAERRA